LTITSSRPLAFHSRGHQGLHVVGARHVGAAEDGFAARGVDFGSDALALLGIHIVDDHLGAFFGQAFGNAFTNAAAGAGDDDGKVFDSHVVSSL
jgi:hypothetical protein